MTLIGALVETLGVSIIIPFVQAMVNPQELIENRYIKPFTEWFHIKEDIQIVVFFGGVIALVYILKNVYLTILSYCRVRYATKVQRELSVLMMKSYMKRGYLFFSQTNTSNLLRGIITDVAAVYQIMYNAFRVVAELFTTIAIVIYIMKTDIRMSFCVIGLASICFVVVVLGLREPMRKAGVQYRESNKDVNQHALQAFQGIKEVIVMHRQKFFVEKYEEAFARQQKATVGQTVGAESPAFIIEAVCVAGLILAVSFRGYNGMDMVSYIPKLASFAMGAFRILPSLGRITSSFNQMVYYAPSLDNTYENLKEVRIAENDREPGNIRLQAEQQSNTYLEIRDIHWQYPAADREVLSGINLSIEKGSSVAFIGQSGAGKTTLADIILGLYRPKQGNVLYRGKDIRTMEGSWGQYIGYIPQSVYLTDDTIRSNVAFGVEHPDEEKIWRALEEAQLKDFVLSLPQKLDTVVGDRGIRFSGGQKQRVAIARALYNDPEILILDEATSALDNDTETAVMEAIDSLQGNKTLIIVAHRLTTIRNCDVIYEIADGRAVERKKKEIL
ncbi:MAG: ABC transporter ATP-binding protein/permease [bacterium]|nr:ABC transporter ATP-binding protein/permease [bacterium]